MKNSGQPTTEANLVPDFGISVEATSGYADASSRLSSTEQTKRPKRLVKLDEMGKLRW